MTNNYLSQLLNEFDNEFKSLIIPFTETETYVVASELNEEKKDFSDNKIEAAATNTDDLIQKLNRIEALATEISAERYSHNYNPEVCLANLLNYIYHISHWQINWSKQYSYDSCNKCHNHRFNHCHQCIDTIF